MGEPHTRQGSMHKTTEQPDIVLDSLGRCNLGVSDPTVLSLFAHLQMKLVRMPEPRFRAALSMKCGPMQRTLKCEKPPKVLRR